MHGGHSSVDGASSGSGSATEAGAHADTDSTTHTQGHSADYAGAGADDDDDDDDDDEAGLWILRRIQMASSRQASSSTPLGAGGGVSRLRSSGASVPRAEGVIEVDHSSEAWTSRHMFRDAPRIGHRTRVRGLVSLVCVCVRHTQAQVHTHAHTHTLSLLSALCAAHTALRFLFCFPLVVATGGCTARCCAVE